MMAKFCLGYLLWAIPAAILFAILCRCVSV